MPDSLPAASDVEISRIESTADFFSLLSLLLFLPTAEIAQGIKDRTLEADMRALLDELGLKKPETATLFPHDASSDDILDAMRQAYTRLFTHPKKPLVPITEMRFVDMRDQAKIPSSAFLNKAALHAESCYRKAGFALANETSREPGDHMGIELEFLGRAHTNLASALRTRDEKSRGFWEGAIRAFNPHMRSWAIDFFESCRRNAQDPFYSRIGRIGCIFMMDYLSRSHEKEDGES